MKKHYYSNINFLIYIIKSRLLSFLVKKCPHMFFLPKDMISAESILTGKHEQHLIKFVDEICQEYNDFFIDIGGHIGLYTCLFSKYFKKTFTFEPNPIIFKILEANISLNDYSQKVSLYNFGLSFKNSSEKILIPKDNTGGAFLLSDDNTKKNIFNSDKNFDKNNFIEKFVEIKSAKEEFKKIYQYLKKNSLKKGFIKIDAEGSDFIILKELLALNLDLNFSVIMELIGISDDEIKNLRKLYPDHQFYFHLSDNFLYKGKNRYIKLLNLFTKKISSELIQIESFYSAGYLLSSNPFYSIDLVVLKNI